MTGYDAGGVNRVRVSDDPRGGRGRGDGGGGEIACHFRSPPLPLEKRPGPFPFALVEVDSKEEEAAEVKPEEPPRRGYEDEGRLKKPQDAGAAR